MWEAFEEEAIFIGLDLEYFWHIDPVCFRKHLRVFSRQRDADNKRLDNLNYILGQYIMYAFNNPKKYPKTPLLSDLENTRNKKQTSQTMEEMARLNTLMLGGILSDGRTTANTTKDKQ